MIGEPGLNDKQPGTVLGRSNGKETLVRKNPHDHLRCHPRDLETDDSEERITTPNSGAVAPSSFYVAASSMP